MTFYVCFIIGLCVVHFHEAFYVNYLKITEKVKLESEFMTALCII